MLYIIVAALFLTAFAILARMDDRISEQRKEMNGLYDVLSRQADRMNAIQKDRDALAKDVRSLLTAMPALEQQIKELSEPIKVKDRQEKLVLDGVNSILNYNIGQALRAAKDVSDYGEEE